MVGRSFLENAVHLTKTDERWPRALDALKHPPSQLFVAGGLPGPDVPAVAIVGTRKPSGAAAAFARGLAAEVSAAGWVVVSGGAAGIDAAAHLGALEAGGITVAVLGTPLSRPYPQTNAGLFERILGMGAIVSEMEHGAAVDASRFVQRNRIIAALSLVTVVVEAPIPSGALSTAAYAKALGRPLLAVPHAPWEPLGAGCVALLAGPAKICGSSRDVLSLAAPKPGESPVRKPGKSKKRKCIQGLDDDGQAVVRALLGGPASVDELCEVTELSAPRAQRAVLMLLLSRVIREVGSGRYARADCL